ncbi:MAG TPA: hypothetical protein VFM05_13125 [Candidatus Saccharimonadales bacterium]|nr:hypothetical protein [Candidatus Saccharimonadales bacterium]
MVCIYCDGNTCVANSRPQKKINQIWRRRQCLDCGNNFTTHEFAELGSLITVRYSSRQLKPFSRDQLFLSIYESCRHRAQTISDSTALTQTIISQLYSHVSSEGVLERDSIATVAHTVLERFDNTAATVYAAYHLATKTA